MPRKQIKPRRPAPAKKGAAQPAVEAPPTALLAEERRRMIAEAAYFHAEHRGFAVGGELDDWLAAEAEIDRLTEGGGSRSKRSLRHM